ncbi:unnamed protein product [Pleuronectes platessa]|uniref:Uncharacterized protein n=1 Tax=Pleuronectes platessa TaxID=8262 RepID=A0A9N7UX20_PLEPL|nr:unnamed protein product [Pleuronectes platessa]
MEQLAAKVKKPGLIPRGVSQDTNSLFAKATVVGQLAGNQQSVSRVQLAIPVSSSCHCVLSKIIVCTGSLRCHIRDEVYSNIIRGIVIQKALSTLTSNMNIQIFTVLLSQFISELVQCFPAAAGGKGVKQFYCEDPDCAAHVARVFCDNVLVSFAAPIEECAGNLPPDSVCQHQGRAFVSTVSGGTCDFEGTDVYIKTKKCTDLDSTWGFTTDTSPPQHQAYVVSIVCGVIGVMIVL